MTSTHSRDLNTSQSVRRTLTDSRLVRGYTRLMRLVGLALVTVAFVATIATNASEARSEYASVPSGPSVSDVMAEHDCWSGEAPADMKGKIPGYAVVDLGDGPAYVNSKIGFDIWLEDRPGKLFGFCR